MSTASLLALPFIRIVAILVTLRSFSLGNRNASARAGGAENGTAAFRQFRRERGRLGLTRRVTRLTLVV